MDFQGLALEGARVSVVEQGEWTRNRIRFSLHPDSSNDAALCDALGQFSLTLKETPGSHRLLAENATGARWVSPPLSSDRSDLGTLHLPKPHRLQGRVLDELGMPIRGAQVLARSGSLLSQVSLTDENGGFLIHSLGGTFTQLQASADGQETTRVRVPNENAQAMIVMSPGALLRGRITGTPPAPMQLKDLQIRARWQGGQALAMVEPGGSFCIAGLAPMLKVQLEAFASAEFAPKTQGRPLGSTGDVFAGTSGVMLILSPSQTLLGQLEDSSGPIPDETLVQLQWSCGQETLQLPPTRGSGIRIETQAIPDGALLRIRASGFCERWIELSALSGHHSLNIGRIQLEPSPRASIQVLEEQSGLPVEGVLLTWGMASCRTSADGIGTLPVPSHVGSLHVHHPEFIETKLDEIIPGKLCVVRLQQGASLSLELTDGDGRPVAGARLRLRRKEAQCAPSAPLMAESLARPGRERTDSSGRARMRRMIPGNWLLEVFVPLAAGVPITAGNPTKSLPIQLVPGKELQLALSLPRRIRTLVIASRAGVPVPNALLESIRKVQVSAAYTPKEQATCLGRTNARGELILEEMLGGPRELRLTPPGGAASHFSIDLSGASPLFLECSHVGK